MMNFKPVTKITQEEKNKIKKELKNLIIKRFVDKEFIEYLMWIKNKKGLQ